MSTELIINASLPETRISLLENGEIQDLLIERASEKGIVGNIYKGRVTRVLPGMQAAFVDIGLEKAAFLYVDDVYVHSEIWEAQEEEGRGKGGENSGDESSTTSEPARISINRVVGAAGEATANAASAEGAGASESLSADVSGEVEAREHVADDSDDTTDDAADDFEDDLSDDDDDDEEDEEDDEPALMSAEGGDGEGGGGDQPPGTLSPGASGGSEGGGEAGEGSAAGAAGQDGRRRRRRGRRGGRFRKGRDGEEIAPREPGKASAEPGSAEGLPENFQDQVSDEGQIDSDRNEMTADANTVTADGTGADGRPDIPTSGSGEPRRVVTASSGTKERPEFKESRGRDRRIKSKPSTKPAKGQVNIQDLLKEGQEVIVQVAKDPIATKGARLTCHISLPGRHLVCMPTIDHVGVSRRIERDDERRKLREYVERYRPKNLGFIVRTASGKGQSEKRIKQDIEYLTRIWNEIREKAQEVTAPALVYEDLNSVLRAIRDWVTEEIDKIVVDSRYHFNEIQRFVSHFMPSLKQKVELYHGDVPIFDAYKISTELARALERKVWLKSGGYLVIDQAEALVAIDVNTGRFVGKKNLEDTILKTNLEAVHEIAYQLRLRNCGGIIILDLIDMEKEENKQRVYRALEEALKKDRARPSILKISELGLVEMTRKRTRDTIIRSMCESCVQCEGKGFIKSKTTVAYEVMREIERDGIERDVNKILVQAHPEVIDILAIDERDTVDQLERRYRKQVYLQASSEFHIEQFEVVSDKGDRKQVSSERGGRDRDRGDRDRGRGGRDRGRGRDRGDRDQNRDRNQNREERSARQPGVEPRIITLSGDGGGSGKIVAEHDPHAASTLDAGGSPVIFTPTGDEDEDRLAFLRAQAAQDAALAKLGKGAAGPRDDGRGNQVKTVTAGGAAPLAAGGKPGEGGRRRRRGRRGGRNRRGRPQDTPGSGGTGGTGGGGGDSAPSGGGGGGSPDGGGSDHSSSPV